MYAPKSERLTLRVDRNGNRKECTAVKGKPYQLRRGRPKYAKALVRFRGKEAGLVTWEMSIKRGKKMEGRSVNKNQGIVRRKPEEEGKSDL